MCLDPTPAAARWRLCLWHTSSVLSVVLHMCVPTLTWSLVACPPALAADAAALAADAAASAMRSLPLTLLLPLCLCQYRPFVRRGRCWFSCWNVTLKARDFFFKYPVPIYSFICQRSYSAKHQFILPKTLSLTFISFLFTSCFVNIKQTIWNMLMLTKLITVVINLG